jgi:hypothetical protein
MLLANAAESKQMRAFTVEASTLIDPTKLPGLHLDSAKVREGAMKRRMRSRRSVDRPSRGPEALRHARDPLPAKRRLGGPDITAGADGAQCEVICVLRAEQLAMTHKYFITAVAQAP